MKDENAALVKERYKVVVGRLLKNFFCKRMQVFLKNEESGAHFFLNGKMRTAET